MELLDEKKAQKKNSGEFFGMDGDEERRAFAAQAERLRDGLVTKPGTSTGDLDERPRVGNSQLAQERADLRETFGLSAGKNSGRSSVARAGEFGIEGEEKLSTQTQKFLYRFRQKLIGDAVMQHDEFVGKAEALRQKILEGRFMKRFFREWNAKHGFSGDAWEEIANLRYKAQQFLTPSHGLNKR